MCKHELNTEQVNTISNRIMTGQGWGHDQNINKCGHVAGRRPVRGGICDEKKKKIFGDKCQVRLDRVLNKNDSEF